MRKVAIVGVGALPFASRYKPTFRALALEAAKKAFDEELFISILEKVREIPADIIPELTLLNTVAHTRAKEMLDRVDEYF